jgi:predicted fused transcriptional regulator/phosphomethylpyrimidine kinase
VSGSEKVVKNAAKAGFKIISMKDPESSSAKIVESLKTMSQLPGSRTPYPAIHVPGGYGIEPILYLFGPSAREVGERSVKLSDVVKS